MFMKTLKVLATRRCLRVLSFALSFLIAAIFFSSVAAAQVLYGSLTGTVTDATNAAIPNAAVTATNVATGEARTVITNGNGEYLVRDLDPGPYSISVKPMGNFGGYTQRI